MKQKAFIIDVDGVMLNWLDGLIRFVKLEFNIDASKNWNEVEKWDLSDLYPDNTPEERWNFITSFNKSPYFSTIQPLEGAVDGMKKLHEIAQEKGYVISLVTSAGTGIQILKNRIDNIHRFFGNDIDEIYVVPLDGSKRHFYSMYEQGSIVLDDLSENLHKTDGLHFHNVLYKSSHNKDLGEFYVVKNWEDFINYVENTV